MTKQTRMSVALAAALAIAVVPSNARAFAQDSVILGNILANNIKQTVQFSQALVTMRNAVKVAKETATFAKDAVQAVENVAMIVQDPVGYLKANAQLFVKSFPEIDALGREVQGIRDTLRNARFDGVYDPYMTLSVLDDLSRVDGAYHILVELVDEWNVSDPHHEMMVHALETQQRASSVQAQINSELEHGRLTAQEATVLGAQAGAVTAEATTQATLILNDLVKQEKVRFAAEVTQAMRDHAAWGKSLKNFGERDLDPEAFAMPLSPVAGEY